MSVTYETWQRHRACERKVRHPSLYDARLAVLLKWRAGRSGAAYQCEHCDGWHTTENPSADLPEVRS